MRLNQAGVVTRFGTRCNCLVARQPPIIAALFLDATNYGFEPHLAAQALVGWRTLTDEVGAALHLLGSVALAMLPVQRVTL
jgi:hypothetical protein